MILKIFYLALFLSVCFAKLPSKLNGGLEIPVTDIYSYHVSIRHAAHNLCSGCIISRSYILTSASCIVLERRGDIMVTLSNLQILTNTKDKLNKDNTGKIHNIMYVFTHENYDAENFWSNDIAMLQTVKPLRYSSTLQNVALPKSHLRVQTKLIVTGWPETSSSNTAIYLQVLGVKAVSHSECTDRFEGFTLFFPTQGCATLFDETAHFTNGDSGSPIVYNDKIVGIVSALTPSNSDTIILTRIWPFKSWILAYWQKYKI